jgi:Lrp/AsnC family transcriptional regulator, leucine-responsive regulatory protein
VIPRFFYAEFHQYWLFYLKYSNSVDNYFKLTQNSAKSEKTIKMLETIMQLDKLDKRILQELQRDGSITNSDLAERVGLSATPCARRVKRMQDEGLILGQIIVLNPSPLGLKLMALVQVSMDRHTPDRFERFEGEIRKHPEVIECLLITGQSADYQLKVIVPDMDAYQEFLLNTITRIEGVADVHSSFIMRKVLDTTALPLHHLP